MMMAMTIIIITTITIIVIIIIVVVIIAITTIVMIIITSIIIFSGIVLAVSEEHKKPFAALEKQLLELHALVRAERLENAEKAQRGKEIEKERHRDASGTYVGKSDRARAASVMLAVDVTSRV